MSDRKLPMERSERLLNELLKIPVNTICCDCGAANPKWASTSIGCFLCMRCCSVHRKMGTHISKIKSISLDAWTQEEIDNMKNRGNGKVNQLYMPHPERHPPPTSMEGSGMEQYIRAKYERKEFMEGGGGGGHQPSRSAYGNSFSGGGSNNGVTTSARYTDQVRSLREMGFTDNARNLQALQSTDGDVQSAVEILCRIGSGPTNLPSTITQSPSRNNTLSPSNSNAAFGRRVSPMNTGSSAGGKPDPKETILWNMGFHDKAMNREALRRAGGNAEVAAGILIDEKDKIAKAVRDQGGSSSPLPARLSPPSSSGRNNSSNNRSEDLLLDLGPTEEEKQQQLQRQQQQQQMLMMQRQMQMLQQQQGGTADNSQLQAILNANANLLSTFDTNNNNNNNMGQMGMGSMGNMGSQNMFGANSNNANNLFATNQNANNMFATNSNMFQQQQPQPTTTSQPFDNLWSMANSGAMNSTPMTSSAMNNNPFSQMPTVTPIGTMGPNAGASMFGTPMSSAGNTNNIFGATPTNPFGTANSNMFGNPSAGQQNMLGSGGGMGLGMGMGMNQGTLNNNPMGNMGMGGGGMGGSMNSSAMGMGGNNQFSNAFGFNNNNNNNPQNQNQNNNWGMGGGSLF